MYTFSDRGDRSLTLRPEGTAPICRAYVEHGLHREPQPQKLFTIAPMYRYAAPQKGRYREHWQISVEAIGSADPALDAELIQLYDGLLRTLGLSGYRLALNSIGDGVCRPAYLERLHAWLGEHDAELDEETRAKIRTSALRVFDNFEAKPAQVQAALAAAPKIGESLCAECQEHFDAVRSLLGAFGVDYRARADARPRARLLHANDMGVPRARSGSAVDDLRRRALRRPDRGDRRAADAGSRASAPVSSA